MAKLINCECGYVVRGEDDDELVANAEEHMLSDHPEMVGTVTRDDLLGLLHKAPDGASANVRLHGNASLTILAADLHGTFVIHHPG